MSGLAPASGILSRGGDCDPVESLGGRPGIAIITAMGVESAGLSRALEAGPWERRQHRGWQEGLLAGCPAVLATCGVGPRAAHNAAHALLEEYTPQAVILTGVSGGVAPHVDIGDLVLAESIYDCASGHVTARYPADPDLLAIARAVAGETLLRPVRRRSPRVIQGGVGTTNRPAGRPAWAAALAREHGIVAVEMEGAAIARVCAAQGVPLLVVRAVYDIIGRPWQWVTKLLDLRPAQRNAERLIYAVVERLGREE